MTRFTFIGFGCALTLSSACGGSSNVQNQGSSGQGGGGEASGGMSGAGAGGSAGNNSGGATTAGMAGVSGASGGSGGGSPTGQIGVVGESCSPAGALACAGNYQKVTVVCGGDGTWEANETCASGQFCNSEPGPDAGLCAEPPPECAGKMPGERFCNELSVMQCGADTLTIEPVEECQYECADGACVGVECDPNTLVNCTTECAGPTENCYDLCSPGLMASDRPPLIDLSTLEVGHTYILRLPVPSDVECACADVAPELNGLAFRLSNVAQGLFARVDVEPPWGLGVYEYFNPSTGQEWVGNGCAGLGGADSCANIGPSSSAGPYETLIWLDATEATTRSLVMTLRIGPYEEVICLD